MKTLRFIIIIIIIRASQIWTSFSFAASAQVDFILRVSYALVQFFNHAR